ncbi:MAG: hypothetical protein CFK49_11130 [Armatimonadetes bacterium JP3_11]|jgi:O-antigen/teichoic acid export membrane protein|nr:MAG: hypothetical protein CFK49_11130 [Armatimonadetes bacterium JP3_11]RMH10163.1 MAG: hypothetical protein D6697_01865 [Armatimonadota bacterium]
MTTIRQQFRAPIGDTPLKRRLIRAVSWSVLGTGTSQGLFLLASILTARWLGAEDFGRLGLIQFTLNTLVTFIAPSFGWSLMRLAATLRDHDAQALSEQSTAVLQVGALVSLVLALGLTASAPWICAYWFKDTGTQAALQIAAFSVFANGVFTLQSSLLAGFEAFRENAILNTSRGVLLAVMMAGGAYGAGLIGAAWGFTLSSYLSALVGGVFLMTIFRERGLLVRRASWRRGSVVLRDVSLPSFLSTVLSSLTMWAGSVLLARAPNGLAQVALFNAANHWKTVMLFLPTQISQSTAPIMANLWSMGELGRLRALVRTNLLLNLATAGMPCLIIVLAAAPILHLYQLGSATDAFTLRVLALSGVMTALCSVLGYTMIAMGRLWQGLAVNALWAIVFLAIAGLMLHQGAAGLSIAYLTSYTVLFMISLTYVIGNLGMTWGRMRG